MSPLVIVGGLGALMSLTAGLLKIRAERALSEKRSLPEPVSNSPLHVTITRGDQTIYAGKIEKASVPAIQSLVEREEPVSASASR